jgi:DNA-binding MarR family transcriptional regulator
VVERSLVPLLSQAFVAFTIEADNEFEARMPHRTAADRGDRSKTGPWMTSLTYYSNYLRHIPSSGVTARDLARAAGDRRPAIASRLQELARWGYLRVRPTGDDHGEWVVELTPAGARARETWAPIETLVEERWRARFGDDAIDGLQRGLGTLPNAETLPLGFPILAWDRASGLRPAAPLGTPGLSSLLARAILAITIDFDHAAPLSLATTLDLARVLADPVSTRDLPLRAGVSREAIAIGVGRLVRSGLAAESGAPKTVKLTPRGHSAAKAALELCAAVDESWPDSSGLAEILGEVVGPRLAEGLEPPDDGWRARSPYLAQTRATLADPAAALPHFPMVSHRGGYPDGS